GTIAATAFMHRGRHGMPEPTGRADCGITVEDLNVAVSCVMRLDECEPCVVVGLRSAGGLLLDVDEGSASPGRAALLRADNLQCLCIKEFQAARPQRALVHSVASGFDECERVVFAAERDAQSGYALRQRQERKFGCHHDAERSLTANEPVDGILHRKVAHGVLLQSGATQLEWFTVGTDHVETDDMS